MTCPATAWWLSLLIAGAAGTGIGLGVGAAALAGRALLRFLDRD